MQRHNDKMENWVTKQLGEICDIQIGGTPSRNNPALWDTDKQTENYWVSIRDLNQKIITSTDERISDLGTKKSNAKRISKDTILLSFKLTIGKVAFAGTDLYTNEAIAALVTDKIDNEFLYFGLQHWDLLQDVDQAIKGATLNKEKLKKLRITYPEKKSEQTAIAEVLSKIDLAIEQTQKLIEKQKRIKQGLMQDLLTKGIDEDGNIRNEKTHRFKDSPLGRIPEEWEVCNLNQLTTVIVDGIHHTPRYVENGIPFITISDMTRGSGIDFSQTRFITEKDHNEFKRRILPKVGDVLVTKDGTLGKARIVLNEYPEFSIFVSVAVLRPNYFLCISEFIWNFFDSNMFENQLGELSAGTGLKHIHLEHFRNFLLATPPVEEQKWIFEQATKMFSTLESEKKKLTKLKVTKQGLMQDLLTGKKSVKDLISG